MTLEWRKREPVAFWFYYVNVWVKLKVNDSGLFCPPSVSIHFMFTTFQISSIRWSLPGVTKQCFWTESSGRYSGVMYCHALSSKCLCAVQLCFTPLGLTANVRMLPVLKVTMPWIWSLWIGHCFRGLCGEVLVTPTSLLCNWQHETVRFPQRRCFKTQW